MFFFFQAEDGIRDYKVTGVQTCALPILPASSRSVSGSIEPCGASVRCGAFAFFAASTGTGFFCATSPPSYTTSTERSEERRVGKKARGRRGRYNSNKRTQEVDGKHDLRI